jgi:large subunit ribosomal protein L18e
MMPSSTRPEFAEAKRELRAAHRKTGRRIWADLERRILSGEASRTIVNISRLAKHTERGDYVVIPGKLLGVGQIRHRVTVGALGYSQSALSKLKQAKCRPLPLSQFVKKYSKKEGVKIIG